MTLDPGTRRSRRSLLAAAASSAVGIAAVRLATPDGASAVPTPLYINQDNPTNATTSITTNGVNAFSVSTNTQATAIHGSGGSGNGVVAQATSGVGLMASSNHIAVNAYSPSGMGVDASTSSGTAIRGTTPSGTAVLGHVGGGSPTATASVALQGSVADKTEVGIRASGRVQFPDRSGRAKIAAGKAAVAVPVAGMTSGNYAMATLGSSRTGRWVRAVVCSSGKITIYLNGSVTRSTSVHWLVLG
jgi:hypothetical protein